MPMLPADILLLIVDAVGEADNPQSQLRACALTNRTLWKPSQVHLFKSPTLSTVHEYASFAQALDSSPELSCLVQHIQLHLTPIINKDMPLQPYIVAALKNLRSASFFGGLGDAAVPRPDCTRLERAISFVKLFGVLSPTFTRLALADFHFLDFADLARIVWSFPNITSLSLATCHWLTKPDQQEIDDLPAIELYPRGRASRLTSLTLRLSVWSRLNLTIPVWGNSVRNLDIRPAMWVDNFEGMSAFSALESLRLTLYWSPRPLVTALTCVRSPVFRRLVVQYNVRVVEHQLILDDVKALKLDTVLSPEAFPQLKEVDWTLVYQSNGARAEEDAEEEGLRWVREIGEQMPGLRDRGLLACTAGEGNVNLCDA